MRAPTTLDLALAGHRYLTESALAALRIDNTLDDRERSRRITRVIESANARAVELLRRRQHGMHAARDRQAEPEVGAAWRADAVPEQQADGSLLRYR
jgi:hypothetical protein